MILRRLATSIRKQDWFTVVIETLIVVFGVFIGLQVNNWNGAQSDRRTESAYLQRLHDDVASLITATAQERDYATAAHALLQAAMEAFDSADEARLAQLGAEHCSAIIRSHIYASAIVTPPTITELLQSGGVGLIRDTEIRIAILRFDQGIGHIAQLRTDLQINRRLLGRSYPEHIKVGLRRWGDSHCSFAELAGDQGFLNDFADNLRRYDAFTNDVIGRLYTLQLELHSLLDVKLGIAHGAGDTP